MEALRSFGIDGLFDNHLIEPHEWKGRTLARFLRLLWRDRRLMIARERIVYFDDRGIFELYNRTSWTSDVCEEPHLL